MPFSVVRSSQFLARLILLLILVFDTLWEILQAGFGKPFQALRLGEQGSSQTTLDATFAYPAGETGDGCGTAGNANIGVLAVWEDAVGDYASGV